MSIDVKTPNTPGWWLQKTAKKLEARQVRLQTLARYHDGNPPLPDGADSVRDAYKAFQKKARTNFAELIVGAVRERCSVRAVRTALGEDLAGDAVAWNIWRENNLDIEFSDVLENMLALGDGYMIVGLDPDDPEQVVITGEDPRQVVTIHNPLRQSEVRAALKMFHDPDEEKDYAFLYLAGERLRDENGDVVKNSDGTAQFSNARRYVASRPRKTASLKMTFSASAFNWDEDLGGVAGEELNHRFAPVVRFRNRRGIGEFEPHLDVLDRINHTLLQRMVIAMYQAFRMHAIQVDENDMPDEDDDGKTIDYDDILTADPGAFLKLPAGAQIWESQQADMNGVLSAIKDDLTHLMAVTRTPMTAISDAANQSAEGAALVKEGQIFKTEDKQKRAAASLALVYMIAFLCLEDTERADKQRIVIDWAPAERFSLQQKYDAASKAPEFVPGETVMAEVLQFSPELIEIAKQQQMDEAIQNMLTQPQPAAPAAPPAPNGENANGRPAETAAATPPGQ